MACERCGRLSRGARWPSPSVHRAAAAAVSAISARAADGSGQWRPPVAPQCHTSPATLGFQAGRVGACVMRLSPLFQSAVCSQPREPRAPPQPYSWAPGIVGALGKRSTSERRGVGPKGGTGSARRIPKPVALHTTFLQPQQSRPCSALRAHPAAAAPPRNARLIPMHMSCKPRAMSTKHARGGVVCGAATWLEPELAGGLSRSNFSGTATTSASLGRGSSRSLPQPPSSPLYPPPTALTALPLHPSCELPRSQIALSLGCLTRPRARTRKSRRVQISLCC